MTILSAYLSHPKIKAALTRKSGDSGFSLIELVVVVAVLAILAAIAIPQFTSLSDDARINSAKSILTNMYKECEFNKARTGTGTHTAATDNNPNGVTWNAEAKATTCTAAATATIANCPGGVSLDLTNGSQLKWPQNKENCAA
jgi:type IV pilus assembly protein PilA